MTDIGGAERATQNRVIDLFTAQLAGSSGQQTHRGEYAMTMRNRKVKVFI